MSETNHFKDKLTTTQIKGMLQELVDMCVKLNVMVDTWGKALAENNPTEESLIIHTPHEALVTLSVLHQHLEHTFSDLIAIDFIPKLDLDLQ